MSNKRKLETCWIIYFEWLNHWIQKHLGFDLTVWNHRKYLQMCYLQEIGCFKSVHQNGQNRERHKCGANKCWHFLHWGCLDHSHCHSEHVARVKALQPHHITHHSYSWLFLKVDITSPAVNLIGETSDGVIINHYEVTSSLQSLPVPVTCFSLFSLFGLLSTL